MSNGGSYSRCNCNVRAAGDTWATKLDKIKNLYDQVPVANLTGSHGMAKPICTGDGEFDTLEKQPFRLRTTSRR